MTPVRIATARNADTNPMVQPSLSMINLQIIISTVPGLPPPRCTPGAVGSHLYKLRNAFLNCICSFTVVKKEQCATMYNPINTCYKYVLPKFPVVWPAFGPVNISGIYRDNAWPTPVENACRAFCRLSIPSITSREIYPALKPAWHWSVFPVALSCKALPVTSYLLY